MMTDAEKRAEKLSNQCSDFALRMRRIPRLAVRCEVYGTVSATVDRRHALNIFRKVISAEVTPAIAYEAMCVLQERLDAA